jgi:hypothetical protein
MNTDTSKTPTATPPDPLADRVTRLEREVAELREGLESAESTIVELATALGRSWKFAMHQGRLQTASGARIAAIQRAIIPALSSATERDPLSVAVELDQVAAKELEDVLLTIGDFAPRLAEFFDPRSKRERERALDAAGPESP